MANEQQQQKQQDPTKKKGFLFAILPFFPWFFITMIALLQNKAFEKISQATSQNAVASTGEITNLNPRERLKACYAKLKLNRNVDPLTDEQVKSFLEKCNQSLKEAS